MHKDACPRESIVEKPRENILKATFLSKTLEERKRDISHKRTYQNPIMSRSIALQSGTLPPLTSFLMEPSRPTMSTPLATTSYYSSHAFQAYLDRRRIATRPVSQGYMPATHAGCPPTTFTMPCPNLEVIGWQRASESPLTTSMRRSETYSLLLDGLSPKTTSSLVGAKRAHQEMDVATDIDDEDSESASESPQKIRSVSALPLATHQRQAEPQPNAAEIASQPSPIMGVNASTCRVCSKTFAQASYLAKHMELVHVRSRPHECTLCNKVFGQRGDLLRHSRSVHQKLRPHNCKHCNARFTSKGNLRKHVRTVHSSSDY